MATASTTSPKIVIVGAGPTGIGAALRCEDLGHDNWLMLDSAPEQGGLSRSFEDPAGFTWDIGGHVIFSHYAYFDDAMDYAWAPDDWNNLERVSWVWVEGVWVPYPFQNNIHRLPNDQKQTCLEGLIDVHRAEFEGRPSNFEEYFNRQFGAGISNLFMAPYNFKVWAVPPAQMSTEWVGERVATVDVKRVCKNIIHNTDDLGWGPNATFRFPKQGGTGGIWKNIAAKLPSTKQRIGSEFAMVSVNAVAKTIALKNGDVISYDYLLSTIPIDELLGQVQVAEDLFGPAGSCMVPPPATGPDAKDDFCKRAVAAIPGTAPQEAWGAIAKQFVHSSTNVIGIGIRGSPPAHLESMCWMYFPESTSPFYRATVFSNYAATNAPAGCWSLMVEVSESSQKPVNQDTLIEDCVAGCFASDLLKPEDEIVSKWSIRLAKGYPTPFIGRDQLLAQVQPSLLAAGIYSRGRFGGWRYEVGNQDHSMMQGVEAVEAMLALGKEITYPCASVVNAAKEMTRRLSLLKKE